MLASRKLTLQLMSTLKFKTNIKCGSCVKTVTPFLDQLHGIKSWKVDLTSPEKILTVEAETADPAAVIRSLEKAGYKAEPV